ncbi:MAG: copper homeostasis membrane protein CopD [Alphaproteobacteria bacterium]
MVEAAVIGARITQLIAAVILFGTPLFFLYAIRGPAAAQQWLRPLLAGSASLVLAGALVSLSAQTAVMAGDPAAAVDLDILSSVLGDSGFGRAIIVRLAAACAALAACLALRPGPKLWMALSGIGAVVLATFAWTGHGAAEEGAAGLIHAAADVLHLLAAGIWLGALAAFAILLAGTRPAGDRASLGSLHEALKGFSGIGSAVVAIILATGLVNSWFLVGPDRILSMANSTYGLLLLVKLGLFVAMLGLAALNRFFLTPALQVGLAHDKPAPAIATLRRTVLVETTVGVAIMILVGVLGTLAPVTSL